MIYIIQIHSSMEWLISVLHDLGGQRITFLLDGSDGRKEHSQSSEKAPRKDRDVGLSTTEGKPSVLMADRIPRFTTAQPPQRTPVNWRTILPQFCHSRSNSCHRTVGNWRTIEPSTIRTCPPEKSRYSVFISEIYWFRIITEYLCWWVVSQLILYLLWCF